MAREIYDRIKSRRSAVGLKVIFPSRDAGILLPSSQTLRQQWDLELPLHTQNENFEVNLGSTKASFLSFFNRIYSLTILNQS